MTTRPTRRRSPTAARLLAGAALLAAATGARAADYAGTYRGEIRGQAGSVELTAAAAGYDGTIHMGRTDLPCHAVEQGDRLSGTFTSGGSSFPFTATLAGDALTLSTGSSTFHLDRPAVNPLDGAAGHPANPLAPAADAAAANPLATDAAPAASGSTAAADRLDREGQDCQFGEGHPADLATAAADYAKAADGGSARGANHLGMMLLEGTGVPKDEARAAALFRRAADGGLAAGAFNLAAMYEQGQGGLPKDAARALPLFRQAAAGGDGHAMNWIGLYYENGSAGLVADEAKAVAWFAKAVDAGDAVDGGNNLGFAYFKGEGGLPQDYARARQLFLKSAEGGSVSSMVDIGSMYDKGQGGPADHDQAVRWLGKAARAGDADAAQWIKDHNG